MGTYQSHTEGRSTSDSLRKLERIRLPGELTGKRVLDIGCCEGFFCRIAVERGAKDVVGIDVNDASLEFARNTYGPLGIDFQKRSWANLPGGHFDVVIWLSAMHYEPDPFSVFRQVAGLLAPGGTFILECGVHGGKGKRMVYAKRNNDTPIYPTQQFLEDQLKRARFEYQMVAQGERTPGDDIPRYVYHCWHRKTSVLLVRGRPGSGKSSLAEHLGPVATKVIGLDTLLESLAPKGGGQNPVCEFIQARFNKNNLQPVYEGLDRNGLTKEYIRLLGRHIATSDDLVVIEGYMTDAQVGELIRQISNRAIVWDATRPDRQRFQNLAVA